MEVEESIESQIKKQFEKVHRQADWITFKFVSEYYFLKAASLLKKDIKIDESEKPYRLLLRNIQKRLFLGIATELLLKSCYLKNGYTINKVKVGKTSKGQFLRFDKITTEVLDPSDTLTLNNLIVNFNMVNPKPIVEWRALERGLKILKVFRNKEGHVALLKKSYSG